MPASVTGVVKHPVESSSQPSLPEKPTSLKDLQKSTITLLKKKTEKIKLLKEKLYANKRLLPSKKDVEVTQNFPDAQRLLTVIRTGYGARQTWGMIEEAINSFKISPPIATVQN